MGLQEGGGGGSDPLPSEKTLLYRSDEGDWRESTFFEGKRPKAPWRSPKKIGPKFLGIAKNRIDPNVFVADSREWS